MTSPPADLARAQQLLASFWPLSREPLRDVTVPLSAIISVVTAALEHSRFFPPELRPEDLGDGAVIERLGRHRYRVYERFEVGQLRFSDLSSRSYFFRRGAVLRYLRHYRALMRIHRVKVGRWS